MFFCDLNYTSHYLLSWVILLSKTTFGKKKKRALEERIVHSFVNTFLPTTTFFEEYTSRKGIPLISRPPGNLGQNTPPQSLNYLPSTWCLSNSNVDSNCISLYAHKNE